MAEKQRRSWHKRYHGDAISGYMGLSLEERGAYVTLKDYIYDRGGPLPDNIRMLAGYIDTSVRKARAVVESLIAKGKLYRTDDGKISNRRCDQELMNQLSQADHMAEIGSSGGNKSAERRRSLNKNNDPVKRTLEPRSTYARSQKPEARTRKKEKGKAVEGAIAPPAASLPVAAVVLDEIDLAIQAYNDGAAKTPQGENQNGWTRCGGRSAARDKAIKARLATVGLDGWKAAVVRGIRSDFLAGRSRRSSGHESWRVNILWFSKAENFMKLQEGGYDNGGRRGLYQDTADSLGSWLAQQEAKDAQ